MKLWLNCIGLLVLVAAAAAQDNSKLAVEAARKWLSVVDAGHYAQSWDAAAQAFQQHITKQDWQDALDQVRKPLGQVQSRKLESATHHTELPGAPKGDYYVIHYQTKLADGSEMTETIVPMLENGQWKVSGYFIKPVQ